MTEPARSPGDEADGGGAGAPAGDDRQRLALERVAALARVGTGLRCPGARRRLATFLRLAEAAALGWPRLREAAPDPGEAGGWR